MTETPVEGAVPPGEPARNPWPWLLTGVAAAAAGLVLSWFPGDATTPVRVLLILVGLLAGGRAVVLRYDSWRLLLAAAGLAAVAFLALDREWDTVRLAVGLLAAVAAAGSALAALPPDLRRTVFSLLVLFHFGGLLVAATIRPPPGYESPWLQTMLSAHVYQSYLDLLLLNADYNYYSPEPTPDVLLWIRVEYAGGQVRWVWFPNRKESSTDLEFSRWARLAEHVSHVEPSLPDNFDELKEKRRLAANGGPRIPFAGDNIDDEYQPPTRDDRRCLESYARCAARFHPHPADPEQKVVGVKMYRVVHQNITPQELAAGTDPADPTFYLAAYLGEYSPDGALKSPDDPLLYWRIPIFYEEDGSVTNCVRIHAGVTQGDEPW